MILAVQRPENPLVSVVVPVMNEAGCIAELVERVRRTLVDVGVRYEIIFVDDGSADATVEQVAMARIADPAVKLIRFTRNFGHQAALVAGLRFAEGDVAVTMDGDLQHPPEFLASLLEAWRKGFDVVHTIRQRRSDDAGGWRETTGTAFYKLMMTITRVPIVPTSADFRLLDRRVVDSFNELEEHFVFVRGLIPWFGYSETSLHYELADRFAGQSKYSLTRMIRLALDGIFSFTVVPLRLITMLGLVTTVFGILFAAYCVFWWALGDFDVSGWMTIVILILLFGGVQLLSIGTLAEYVGRTYEEVKRRPRYVIESMAGIDPR